jgi:hypothetical protein
MILNNNFNVENLLMEGNSAYYGGAVFVSADLSANATFNNLTFVNNVAAEGKQVTFSTKMTRPVITLPMEGNRCLTKAIATEPQFNPWHCEETCAHIESGMSKLSCCRLFSVLASPEVPQRGPHLQ